MWPILFGGQLLPFEPLPYGHSVWKADDILSGHNRFEEESMRPSWRVENEEEVRLAFERRKQPRLTCSYCGGRCDEVTRDSVDKAVRWFHAHDCRTQEQAECEALILSLRPLAKTTFAESLSSEAA